VQKPHTAAALGNRHSRRTAKAVALARAHGLLPAAIRSPSLPFW